MSSKSVLLQLPGWRDDHGQRLAVRLCAGLGAFWFFVTPLPMLTSGNPALVKTLNGWHQIFTWALSVVAGLHVTVALVHLFYYRDGVRWRMLPGRSGT